MDNTYYASLIAAVFKEYDRTGKDEFAGHGISLVGMCSRETKTTFIDGQTHPSMVEMAVKAMEYYAKCQLCNGDEFDKCFRLDSLQTGWLLATHVLRNHSEEYKHQIATAKCVLEGIAEQIDETSAMSYIRNDQPPYLFMNESWNNGLWRSYYDRLANTPNAQVG